jgi:hypothetical protein
MCLVLNDAIFLPAHGYKQTSVSGALSHPAGAYERVLRVFNNLGMYLTNIAPNIVKIAPSFISGWRAFSSVSLLCKSIYI